MVFRPGSPRSRKFLLNTSVPSADRHRFAELFPYVPIGHFTRREELVPHKGQELNSESPGGAAMLFFYDYLPMRAP